MQLSYAKVAEFQARGLVHFHAIFRLDATTPDGAAGPARRSTADAARRRDPHAAASTWFATVAHPARPKGWDIRWGAPARHPHRHACPPPDGSPNIAVAAYLAKYATKSTEAVGTVKCRITAANVTSTATRAVTREG